MTVLGSLTSRIFLASATLAVLSIAAAVYFVSRTTTRQAEAELQRGLLEAGTLVDQQCATLVQTLTVMARLVADDPKLKAAVDTGDPPTVLPLARDYQKQLNATLIVLTGRNAQVLAESGELESIDRPVGNLPEIQQALAGRESRGFWPHADGMLQVTTVPITIEEPPEIMGALTLGFRLDHDLAMQFKRATESDIAFAVDGKVRASTLAPEDGGQLATLLKTDDVQTIALTDGEYVALKRPLLPTAGAGESAPTVLLLRSRSERLRFLNAINTGLAIVAVVAVLASTILSYAVARTITRPLATITDTMREMSATGDLARKIVLSRAAGWEDEDAKLLASTFNALTDSIARFQREAAQRERLSALGRLSTVIAHEIRNPLMIIKGSLRTLASEHVSRDDIKQALLDVDGEVARLNRVVNDVLDFARPIRFDYAPADVNALCVDAEHASRTEHEDINVSIRTDPSLPQIVTDGERLRTALVNILANARHAVAARVAAAGSVAGFDGDAAATAAHGGRQVRSADIEVATEPIDASGVRISIRDRGVGVAADDLPRVFEPYFTTKRTGSGLGLAIAKNIIEGMGGSILLDSQPGIGTHIRIDLPLQSAPQSSAARTEHRSPTRSAGSGSTLIEVDRRHHIRRSDEREGGSLRGGA
jgi:signal transduction histidine kinase